MLKNPCSVCGELFSIDKPHGIVRVRGGVARRCLRKISSRGFSSSRFNYDCLGFSFGKGEKGI
jgi:ribosomal protein S14